MVRRMSLKAVEMQVAIHRTHDAGLLQNNLNQKPGLDQAMLVNQTLKHLDEQRKRTNETNESSQHLRANQDGNQNQNQHSNHSSKKKTSEDTVAIEHPFKGHHIDLSL